VTTRNVEESPRLPTGLRLIVQVGGFLVGIALVVWCVQGAFAGGGQGWSKLRDADPILVAGMLACSLVSLLVNGALFWTAIRPVRKEGFWTLQGINFTSGLLNYAPVRLGLLSRFVYHVRVDRMSILFLLGWFAVVTIAMAAVLGSSVVATVIHPMLDPVWLAIFIAPLAVLVLVLPWIASRDVVTRFTKGAEAMLRHRGWFSAGLVLRTIDLAMWTARIALAAAILDLDISSGDILIVAVAALLTAMNPLGRIGYREAAVRLLAGYLAAPTSGQDLDSAFAALAILESVSEAAVTIPCGLLAVLWWYPAIRKGRRKQGAA